MAQKKKSKKAAKTKRRRPTSRAALTATRRDLARLLGCSLRHVTDLEAEGVFVPLERGRGGRPSVYALEAALPAYIRRVTEAPTSGSEREARRRRDMAQAKLTELKIAREEGELVDRETVVREGTAFVLSVKAKLRSLPRQCVHRGLPREFEALLEAEVRQALMEIARWRTIDDDERAEVAAADERLAPVYVSPEELRRELEDPRHWLSRVEPSLRKSLSALAAEGRGIVRYRSGGWAPWPVSPESAELGAER